MNTTDDFKNRIKSAVTNFDEKTELKKRGNKNGENKSTENAPESEVLKKSCKRGENRIE